MSTNESLGFLPEVTTFVMDEKRNESTTELIQLSPMFHLIVLATFIPVFVLCLIGNMIVLYVLTRKTQICSRTNWFLANLAVADICVGIFCVLPTMFKLLNSPWILGRALCKISKFVESTNITASMLLLEVIAVERYIAIHYPLRARHLFTRYKLYFSQISVWVVSCLYNAPFLFMWDEHHSPFSTNAYCYYAKERTTSTFIYYVITFVVWYLIPLLVMTVLYCKISRTLWKSNAPNYMFKLRKRLSSVASSNLSEDNGDTTATITQNSDSIVSPSLQRVVETKLNQPMLNTEYTPNVRLNLLASSQDDGNWASCCSTKAQTVVLHLHGKTKGKQEEHHSSANNVISEKNVQAALKENCKETNVDFQQITYVPERQRKRESVSTDLNPHHTDGSSHYRVTSQRASSRRKVIRLLLVIVITFALLVLPNHLRLILYFKANFEYDIQSGIITPLTYFLLYLNSALNPILYSLFSQNFRRCIKEAISRCIRKK